METFYYIYFFFTSSDSQAKCKRIGERDKMLQNGRNRRNKHRERNRDICYMDVT